MTTIDSATKSTATPNVATVSINLGRAEKLQILFAYPNSATVQEDLQTTILHWLGDTIERDGLNRDSATINVVNGEYILNLNGLSTDQAQAYDQRIRAILEIGLAACVGPIQQIQKRSVWCTDGKIRTLWDPNETGKWRFFLTLGVGYVNHRSLQFFHYPPIRLLDPLRDSMQDPVTYRCRDLLIANGVGSDETKFYETRINSTPIAAPDDQGTNNSPAADPVVGGLIPIGYFKQFEIDMIGTLLKPHATPGYTIPMTAYGSEPRQQLGGMFLGPDKAMIIEVIPGLKTPVLGSNHPYRFYATAQGGSTVGSGQMLPGQAIRDMCVQLQQDDLAVVRWQVEMAKDPSQDPWKVIRDSQAIWKSRDKQDLVTALVNRHASLKYDDPDGYHFRFLLGLDGKPVPPTTTTSPDTTR